MWSMFCPVDDVEKVIGLLLREAGDKLNEEVRMFPTLMISRNHKFIVSGRLFLFLFIVPADRRCQRRSGALKELLFLWEGHADPAEEDGPHQQRARPRGAAGVPQSPDRRDLWGETRAASLYPQTFEGVGCEVGVVRHQGASSPPPPHF